MPTKENTTDGGVSSIVLATLPPAPADSPAHPAKFSSDVLGAMAAHVRGRVLDPFAGVGRVHALAAVEAVTGTVGVELEPEWARCHPATIVGNALRLPFRPRSFDTVATSPTFGNRLSDHHNARDGSVRHSYTHDLGHELHADNSGRLPFGSAYRSFHEAAWRECRRVLRVGGLFVVQVSDFIRDHQTIPVVSFHRLALTRLGFTLIHEVYVPKGGLRYGANRERVPHDVVLVFSFGPPSRPRRAAGRRRAPVHHEPAQVPGQLSIYDELGTSQ